MKLKKSETGKLAKQRKTLPEIKFNMHRSFITLILIGFFLQVESNVHAQNKKSTLEIELEQLTNINLLPIYLDHTSVAMESSYDRTEGNDDGFSGKYSYIRKEGPDRLVIADLEGPGVIQRIWTPTPTFDILSFYFDDEAEPRISISFMDLFTGEKYPFIHPLVGNEVGGYYCYLPIPYKKKCKIVYHSERIQFHQIQYRTFKSENDVQTFPIVLSQAETKAIQRAAAVWNDFDVLKQYPESDLKILEKDIAIHPDETVSIAKFPEGGRIVRIEFNNAEGIAESSTHLILRAKWDNESEYAINAPLKHLFGYAFEKPAMKSLLIGSSGDLNYMNFPMPFDLEAELELVYLKEDTHTQPDVTMTAKIYYLTSKRDPATEAKFYTCWRRLNPEQGKPYTILEHAGKGHYVGTILMCQGIEENLNGSISTIFFEGDDITTIDGTMRMHGTGSEDYFNGGWYAVGDRWDKAFSLPLHGCLGYSIPLARTGGYRFLVGDKETFNEKYKLTIEHGPENNNWKVDYASVAFFYGDGPSPFSVDPTPELSGYFTPPKELEILPLSEFSFQSFGFPFDEFKLYRKKVIGKNVYVMHSPSDKGYVKTDLPFRAEGRYDLYVSYIKSPESGTVQIFQRQKIVSEEMDIYSSEYEYVAKQFVGKIEINKNEAPLTFRMHGEKGKCDFILERIHLVKQE